MKKEKEELEDLINIIDNLDRKIRKYSDNFLIRAESTAHFSILANKSGVTTNYSAENGLNISFPKFNPIKMIVMNGVIEEQIPRMLKLIKSFQRRFKDWDIPNNSDDELYGTSNKEDHFSGKYKIDPFSLPVEDKIEVLQSFFSEKSDYSPSRQLAYSETKTSKVLFIPDITSLSIENQILGLNITDFLTKNRKFQPLLYENYVSGGWEFIKKLEKQEFTPVHEFLSENAKLLEDSSSIKTGKYTVILSPQAAGTLAHELGHTAEADIDFAMKKDERDTFFIENSTDLNEGGLNVIDKGVHEDSACFCPFDDEATIAQDTMIYEKGRKIALLSNKEYAQNKNLKTSGNARAQSYLYRPLIRMRNTFIQNGDVSYNELLEDEKNYVYFIKSAGGHFHLGKDITLRGSIGLMIENNCPAKSISNFSVQVPIDDLQNSVKLVGNDFDFFSSMCSKTQTVPIAYGSPHIKMNAIILGD